MRRTVFNQCQWKGVEAGGGWTDVWEWQPNLGWGVLEIRGNAHNTVGLIYALYFVFGAAALDSKVHTLSTANWFLDRIVLIRRQKFHST